MVDIRELLKEADTNLAWTPAPPWAIASCTPKVLLIESPPSDSVPMRSYQVHWISCRHFVHMCVHVCRYTRADRVCQRMGVWAEPPVSHLFHSMAEKFRVISRVLGRLIPSGIGRIITGPSE